MLTELRIQNFKAWRDTGRIRLAPLTVFFGANSSGKSSINQFLLMLKQTAQSPDRQRVLHLGDKSTPIDLGTSRDIAFRHDEGCHLDFSLKWGLPELLTVEDPVSGRAFRGGEIEFNATVGPAGPGRQSLVVHRMSYGLGEPRTGGLGVSVARKESRNGKKDEYEINAEAFPLLRKQGRAWPLPAPARFYGFPEETVAYHQNAEFVSDLVLELEQMLQRIHYLGPLRDRPQRSYTWSGEIPEHVGWQGELAVNAILAAKGRQLNLGRRKRLKPFEVLIADWLKEMGLIESFKVRQISRNRRDYEVQLKAAGSSESVSLTDVGFGISQVLPVLVECFYCKPHATLILEQPEIHLHPSVQACLADLFIAAVKSRENSADKKVQLIVESHSEHFLRRLQRRIAEEEISAEDTAVYFCKPGGDGSEIVPLDIDLCGNIRNWPQGFFGDEISDLEAMVEAGLRRGVETVS